MASAVVEQNPERIFATETLVDPAAWRGADIVDKSDWQISLSSAQVEELKAEVGRHLAKVESGPEAIFQIGANDFCLPGFDSLARRVCDDMESGRGFVLLRGLPVESWGEVGTRLALWGLGLQLGFPEPQDGSGSLIHDVRDIGREFGSDDNIRYFQTNHAIDFHNDGADIFALCCYQQGMAGGRSRLASVAEVFNTILSRHPQYARALQEDFHFDARGQRADGSRCQVHPVLSYFAGRMNVLMKTAYIHSAQRFEDVPRLSELQIQALDYLNQVLEEDGIALEFDAKPGDVIVASNHCVLHGRSAFADGDQSGGQRHMLRLWLTIPNGRPLPPHYADTREFSATYKRRMPGVAQR